MRVTVAPDGTVYTTEHGLNNRVQHFTADGSFLRKWGRSGTGDGEFDRPFGIRVSANGRVFVADRDNSRVQYFSPIGSFLGKFGSLGSGNGEFGGPCGVALTATGDRLYVSETGNSRVQYFKDTEFAVAPASLGRVKALFR